ncbi:glycogen debranching N-terminal domain-containing protein, partial [Nocardioides sp.]|uniref:glycogen debranching N-terminal domain-containing protein n=1 Tax=Nocardioides sp. TaxID=35761 RepID=UPI002D807E19
MVRQPLLHEQLVALAAPTQAWSGTDGQIRAGLRNLHGVFHADIRVLSEAVLTIAGAEPEVIATANPRVGTVKVVALARELDGPGADPATRVDTDRTLTPGRMREHLTVSTSAAGGVAAEVRVRLGADLFAMDRVKAGESGDPVVPTRTRTGLEWGDDERGIGVRVRAPEAGIDLDEPAAPTLVW